MTTDDVRDALVAAIREIQMTSGRPCPELDGATRPIADVEGFDSLNSVEAGVMASTTLGAELPDNPFVAKNGTALSIDEAAQAIMAATKQGLEP